MACLGKRALDGVGASGLEALLSGLKYWSRGTAEHEVLYEERIRSIVTGVRKVRWIPRPPRYDTKTVASMSGALGAEPLDLRDRAIIVLTHISMTTLGTLQTLQRGNVAFFDSSRQMALQLQLPSRRVVQFTQAQDPMVCPVRTMRAWLSVNGPALAGYVFVGRGPRGDWLDTPVNHFLVGSVLRRTARLANIGEGPISTQLILASAIRIAAKAMQNFPLAYVLGFRSVQALRNYGLRVTRVLESEARAFERAKRRWRK